MSTIDRKIAKVRRAVQVATGDVADEDNPTPGFLLPAMQDDPPGTVAMWHPHCDPCPTCGVAAWADCIDAAGTPGEQVHAARATPPTVADPPVSPSSSPRRKRSPRPPTID